MSYIIREMTTEDFGEVLEIFSQGISTNMATFEIECPGYKQWDEAHFDACRLVAEDDCAVVAWVALTPVSRRECYKGVAEVSIYVDFEHKHQGIGEALLDALARQSVKDGFWSLVAYVLEENTASIKLFEKCGYRRVGYYERPAKDKFGVWRNVVIFERRIQTDKAGGCDCDAYKAMQNQ